MVSAHDIKVFDELDKQLHQVNADMAKMGVKAFDLCSTYKSIRPAIVNAINFINGVPGWLKPGWVNTIVSALQTLISLLDKVCP